MTDYQPELNVHKQLNEFYKDVACSAQARDWSIDYNHDPEVDRTVADFIRQGRFVLANVAFDPQGVEALSAWIDTARDLAIGDIKSAKTIPEVLDAVDNAQSNMDSHLANFGYLPGDISNDELVEIKVVNKDS